MSYKRILLVSNNIITYFNDITSYLYDKKNIILIPYSFNYTSSYYDFLQQIKLYTINCKKNTVYTSVGIMFHNVNKNCLQCFSTDTIKNTTVKLSNEYDTFIHFVKTLKIFYNIVDLDIISCDIINNTHSVLNTLDVDGVKINASINIVGTVGDWILELGQINLINRYFNNKIITTNLILRKKNIKPPSNSGKIIKNVRSFNVNNDLNLIKEQLIDVAKKLHSIHKPDGYPITINNNLSNINDITSLYIKVARYIDSNYVDKTIGDEINSIDMLLSNKHSNLLKHVAQSIYKICNSINTSCEINHDLQQLYINAVNTSEIAVTTPTNSNIINAIKSLYDCNNYTIEYIIDSFVAKKVYTVNTIGTTIEKIAELISILIDAGKNNFKSPEELSIFIIIQNALDNGRNAKTSNNMSYASSGIENLVELSGYTYY